jgi:succinate-acetate transporter protein
MSTIDERRERASAGVAFGSDTDGWYGDFARPRVYLTPIAAPSVLGLFGFAGATFIVAASLTGWYGSTGTSGYLAPFVLFFGGLAQFTAGMFAYRARDEVATAMHGMWGSFWLAWGLLNLLVAAGTLTAGTTLNHALGFWFIAVCAITFSAMLGAFAEGSFGFMAVLAALAAGSGLAAVAYLNGGTTLRHSAGYLLVIAACLAWYVATAMMLEASAGKVVLPLVKKEHDANIPGATPTRAIQLEWGEPGVKHGQ